MNGIVNVLKPPGMTSHDIVNFIRKKFNIKKVGHIGTLDPGAAGVLPICVGQATKLANFLINHTKKYRAEITFGFSTDTLDKSGAIVNTGKVRLLKNDEIETVLNMFKGHIKQVPPIYSAKKINGKKLYEYAREGKEIEIPPVNVDIYDIKIVSYKYPYKLLIDVECSKGTYIRSLIRDICLKLNTTGYMSMLIRTEVGPFNIKESITIEEIQFGILKLYDVDYALDMQSIKLLVDDCQKILNGQYVYNIYNANELYVKLYDHNNKFIGIGITDNNKIRPKRILWGGKY